ncbi:MAG TPA: 50S ribosomal protein L15 [Mesotoga sp.]|jgi:large subunit ribosomal protein L15|nr:50S ribosomal protein L15 [Thermotogaceae bacterium]HNU23975.1 50S ribosomal protein L15 [Mesotoga sp.]HOI35452.1 50S ribosomal protein L15 [Mesotoga infera]
MAFNIDDLKPTPGSRKRSKRIGRGTGSGMGKTATRGHKGQGRATGKVSARFEGGQTPLFRRIPVKGFKNRGTVEYATVNLSILEERFESGSEVTPEILLKMRILKNLKDGVKILARGEITKSLNIKANAFSASAKEKIESAGGKAEVI